MAYDISELDGGNPWTESTHISTLPVFKNPVVYYDGSPILGGLTEAQVISRAEEIASLMGLAINSLNTKPTTENLLRKRDELFGNGTHDLDAVPMMAVALCGGVRIEVNPNNEVRIFFETGAPLPDGYTFTGYDTTKQQAKDATQYLLEQYAPIVDMETPALDLFGDYTYFAQRNFDCRAYENSGSLTDRILGYNFNSVRFAPNDDGTLYIIDRYIADLSQKLGDYPIITVQEARELLLQKHYVTTVPEELPAEEYIASVELIYRTSRHDEVFMPYYRFWVELPTMQLDNGLKNFGAFYVPAVESIYLTDFSLWDGRFN